MKLRNSTDFPSHFLRRLVSWCCKQIGLPAKWLHSAQFTNCELAFRGRAWYRDVLIRIGPDSHFPFPAHSYGGYEAPALSDRLETLIWITTHELTHVLQNGSPQGRRRDKEYSCEWHAHQALKAFQADRERLVAEWSAEPLRSAALSAPKPSTVERRAAKAREDLLRWQRKLTLAKGKVKKYTARVRYYEKKLTT